MCVSQQRRPVKQAQGRDTENKIVISFVVLKIPRTEQQDDLTQRIKIRAGGLSFGSGRAYFVGNFQAYNLRTLYLKEEILLTEETKEREEGGGEKNREINATLTAIGLDIQRTAENHLDAIRVRVIVDAHTANRYIAAQIRPQRKSQMRLLFRKTAVGEEIFDLVLRSRGHSQSGSGQ